ncbi:MAG: hypothetical protein ACYCZX_01645 [Rhodospirillaceae bacterium]
MSTAHTMRQRQKTIFSSIPAFAAALLMFAGSPARAAAEPAPVAAPSTSLSSLFVSSMDALTIGITPAYGVLGAALPVTARAAGGGMGIADISNFSSEFTTSISGGNVGLFGERAEMPTLFAPAPVSAWNMGGSLGYAGFYLRAGLSGTPALGPFQRTQGWQAGLGFASGGFDFRLTFLTAQTGNFSSGETEMESQRWTLGGIYRLSSSLRLNADAFYGLRDSRTGMFFTPQPAAGTQAPPGTGARVGVQLRF